MSPVRHSKRSIKGRPIGLNQKQGGFHNFTCGQREARKKCQLIIGREQPKEFFQ